MNKFCLGIDTSNYTTSAALVGSEGIMSNCRLLLPVEKGAIGLRQSNAVFRHIKQIGQATASALNGFTGTIGAIGVSTRPRDVSGSYMPVFKVGEAVANSLAAALKIPVFSFSHQQNHIAAALAGAKRDDLFGNPFIAFHLSGGTADLLSVDGDFNIRPVSTSLDLKPGQLIDRVGKMLGLPFPSGAELDKMALNGTVPRRPAVALINGNFSVSGLENQCRALFEKREKPENIAAYLFSYIAELCGLLCEHAIAVCGDLPIVFAGGVSGSEFIRGSLGGKYETVFCDPCYSSDNAVGNGFLAVRKI